MTRSIYTTLLLFLLSLTSISQTTLKYEDNQTLTWKETVQFYKDLEQNYPNCRLTIAGETDAGKPLHLFVISKDELFDPLAIREKGRAVLLINNGIHPGEPCGIDASAKFALEVLQHHEEYSEMLDQISICIIPVLNVGGALNRSAFHRANQNGPLEQGFRGNAVNNDLNRDFIKLDTRNARSFVTILRRWDPDVLIDTHTSNGADYQYVMTLIGTQRDKLNQPLSEYMYSEMVPVLYSGMKRSTYEMTPYVNSMNRRDPASGIIGFMDHPRYTSGYASLFNTIGFVLETHMFKPYEARVLSCYHFIKVTADYLADNNKDIINLRASAKEATRLKRVYTLDWSIDKSRYEELLFKGYQVKFRKSDVTGLETYYFDRESPWEDTIRNYSFYLPAKTIEAPDFYILPAAWSEVVKRLKLNGIEMYPMHRDTIIEVEYYYIKDFKTSDKPYNGHYIHSNTIVTSKRETMQLLAGDLFIPVNQAANELIVQVLEPEAVDSYFNWNFFDPILSRKEYFSPYVFDELAGSILQKDPELKREFESRQMNDTLFSNNHYEQLKFIYERSPYSEKHLMRYPVARYHMK